MIQLISEINPYPHLVYHASSPSADYPATTLNLERHLLTILHQCMPISSNKSITKYLQEENSNTAHQSISFATRKSYLYNQLIYKNRYTYPIGRILRRRPSNPKILLNPPHITEIPYIPVIKSMEDAVVFLQLTHIFCECR